MNVHSVWSSLESLNSDGQQFQQYQQNKQSPLTSNHCTHKIEPRYIALENQVMAWYMNNNVAVY